HRRRALSRQPCNGCTAGVGGAESSRYGRSMARFTARYLRPQRPVTDLWPLDTNPLARAWDEAKRDVLALRSGRRGVAAPESWDDWLFELFPDYCSAPFAERHREFWLHVDSSTAESTPDPFVSPWPRGGAKSTSAEVGGVKAGVTGRRRYAWYVSETQDQA